MAKKLNLEVKVGIFFVACFLLVVYISVKLANVNLGESAGYTLSAVFKSVAGVNDETPVLLAGLRIGMVTDMRLEGGNARVYFKVRQDAKIPDDSVIAIQTLGFLGSKYLEISPGKSKKNLRGGDQFSNVAVASELSDLSGRAGDIAQDVKAITANLRKVFGDEEGEEGLRRIFENLQQITERLAKTLEDNQARMNVIAENMQTMSTQVAAMSVENRDSIHQAIAAMPGIVDNLRVITDNLARFTSNNAESLGNAIEGLAQATQHMQEAMQHIASITRKIDEGQGTIGQLVNESGPMEDLNETVASLNELVGRIRRLQTFVEYRGEYDIHAEQLRSFLTLRLKPREDVWYSLTVVDDPVGRTSTTTTHTWVTYNPGTPREHTEETIKRERLTNDSLKLTLEIAKRWHWLVFHGGIIESTGGVGVDSMFFDDHLRLSVQAFDFGNADNPRLKANMDFIFLDHFLVTFGADDIVNRGVLDRRLQVPWFVGAGIMFRDDDLVALFSRLPTSGSSF